MHLRLQLRRLARAARLGDLGDREVKFTFDAPGNRELPTIVGELVVLPKHYWEGVDGNGNTISNLQVGSGLSYQLKVVGTAVPVSVQQYGHK